MADRVPPHSREAEESVLGAALLSPESAVSACESIEATDFYVPAHQVIFEALRRLHATGKPVDPVTLTDELRRAGELDKVGGTSYLTRLVDVVPSTANLDHYTRIVREHAYRRRVLRHASELSIRAYDLELDPAALVAPPPLEPITGSVPVKVLEPVDLRSLMEGDPPEEEWLIEPILPARKHVGLNGTRGDGKSLLALDAAAKRAAGKAVLGHPVAEPIHVVYLDQEMGPDDLYERLEALGWTPDHPDFGTLTEHLHYFQLIDLPPLDTEEGGRELETLTDRYGAALVVIDTVSRVVEGPENDNDTYKALHRHTEIRLKRRGVTVWRLDHFGKDKTKGARGASSKEDSLDVVWELKVAGSALTLYRTKGRQSWIPQSVRINREETNGTLSHETPPEIAPQWLIDLVYEIDALEVPPDAGNKVVTEALRAAGKGRRRTDILAAVKFRKGRAQGGSQKGSQPRNPPPEPHREPPGTPEPKTVPDLGLLDGNPTGNPPEPVEGEVSPPIGGNPPTRSGNYQPTTEEIAGI